MKIICPVCGIPVSVTKLGKIFQHQNRNLPKVWHPCYPEVPYKIWQVCKASGREFKDSEMVRA